MSIVYVGDSQSFNYTGNIQKIDILFSGVYKFEVYGAKGGAGKVGETGGAAGGYSVGYKFLNKDDILYIAVGGAGQHTPDTYDSRAYGGWNGGGNAGTHYGGGGGGASHITTALYEDGQLKHYENYKDNVLIVAGGGGGSFQGTLAYEYEGTWHSYGINGFGGTGGGASGGIGTYSINHNGYNNGGSHNNGGQTSGTQTTAGLNAGFGYGGSTTSDMEASGRARGGGGGGWYGGGCGERVNAGGGGGSGYIGNVPTFTYKNTEYASSTENGKRNGDGYVVITSITVETAYQITYELNGGYLKKPIAMYSPEAPLTLPTPVRIGYTFMGWHRDSELADERMFELPAGEPGDVVLYAEWELDVFKYECTNSIQTFVAPYDGLYQLEVWGAQGGNNGGKGGYSIGYIFLDKDTELYVGVGGKGKIAPNGGSASGGYNGGGAITKAYETACASGGGATHIAKTTNRGVLSAYANYKDEILIVAGGGGGNGGAGGGVEGGGTYLANYGSTTGGTQTSPGTSSGGSSFNGSFGQGGSANPTYNNGAGGGGWYGGGGAGNAWHGGAGGSGYVSAVPAFVHKETLYEPETKSGIREGDGYAVITPLYKNMLFCFIDTDGNITEVDNLIFDNNGAITTIGSLIFDGTKIF